MKKCVFAALNALSLCVPAVKPAAWCEMQKNIYQDTNRNVRGEVMKVALITGVRGGIGKATAEIFLQNGYAVVGMGRGENVSPLTGEFTYVQGDISKKESRTNLIDKALTKYGKIDVLVNVAGVAPKVRGDLLDMTEESYDYVMDINTKGTFFLTQAVARQMVLQKSGAIVNISSLSAYTSSTSRGEYCISKAGVSMMTKLFADRLSEYNIPVNEVRPGIIRTGMTEKVQEKYDRLIENGLLPLKRWGEPEDVATAVYALASGALPYVTGQSLDVDGGFHLQRL